MFFKVANLAQIAEFDEIIDVRSPAEFADDHVPGAINCPVLDDDERARVGKLYCQDSPFAARKVGAVLVARNIAHHIEHQFQDRPKSWRPLIYCWRGGQRSGAMAIIMGQIGWPVHQLDHGYKAYRHQVLADLESMPSRLDFKVLCGATGSGKTRLLQALARQGHQVLDLEALARHRGSVLGAIPAQSQPTQKSFESALCLQLKKFDVQHPVYIEAESRSIGRVSLPSALLQAMHAAPCLRLEVPLEQRVGALLADYAYLLCDPLALKTQLERLAPWYPRPQLEAWNRMIEQAQFTQLVESLLARHYDPLYQRSTGKHFIHLKQAEVLHLSSLSALELDRAAQGQF